MKNELLNIKRARDSPDDIIDKEKFEENLKLNNEQIENDNQKEKELEYKENEIKNENYISISSDKLISSKTSKKEENEDDLYELVFNLNSKNNGIECFICKKNLVNNIKFLC